MRTDTTPTTPPPLPGPDGGPIADLLTDPGAVRREVLDSIVEALGPLAPVAVVGVVSVAVATIALWWLRRRSAEEAVRGARLLEVLAPPEPEREGATAFWSNVHEALRRVRGAPWRALPQIAWEYTWREEGLRVRIWVPGTVSASLIERAAEAAWPGARTRVVDDVEPPLPAEWSWAGGELHLSAPEWFPLRTDLEPDPLRAVLGAAACGPGEAAVMQVVVRPLGRRAGARSIKAARQLRLGGGSGLLQGLGAGRPHRGAQSDPTANPDIRLILAKAEQPLWRVTARYGVAREDSTEAGSLRPRAHRLASAFGVFGGRNHLVRRRLRGGHKALRSRQLRRGQLFSTAEVSAVAHLPLDRIVPSLARAGARPVAPPPAIPREPFAGRVLGAADTGAPRRIVLRTEDARYHAHVMGATGSGKSTLLINLVLQDVRATRGAVVIDPNGDLIRDIYDGLDAGARARTILLDPQAPGPVPTLNMLEVPEGITPDLVVDHLIGIFGRIFESSWGPRIEDILRSACLTLLRRPGATLSDVPRILTIPGEYQKYLSTGPEDDLRGFWAWYEAMSTGQRAQVTGPLLYKLRAFLLRPFARSVVNSPTSSIDLSAVLNGGLLLARLPKGLLGEDTAKLLGSFVTSKTWQAATARASMALGSRADCALYIDECQNFLSLPRSFDEVLAEARKYRLSLVLAHQHLGQLPRELRDAVSANARNKLYFKMSPEDAKALERHTLPNLTEHDLRNLGAFQLAARLMCDGEEQPAFTFRTVLPEEAVA